MSRIFISYSHDSREHSERVLALADQLRRNGLDCVIDQYDPSPPQGWHRWMMDQVEQAAFVLVVCTNTYNQRFRGKTPAGSGRGVKWEGAIITQELYEAEHINRKFVAVVMSPEDAVHIPIPLRSWTYYDCSEPSGYENLLRHLTSQPLTPAIEPGERPTLPPGPRPDGLFPGSSDPDQRTRMLDAWVAARVDRVREVFESLPTVRERSVHFPLPARVDGTEIEVPSEADLIGSFQQQRVCLLVVGEGGAGKTSLAFQIARWGMDGRLTEHAMLPVLLDQDFAEKYSLAEAVGRELRELVAEAEEPDEQLVLELLRQRRILVIVDHFSEMDRATQKQIEDGDSAVNALLVTSRDPNVLTWRRLKVVIEPELLDRELLFEFMHEYLKDRGKRKLFKDPVFEESRRKLEAIVAGRAITPLFAKLYLDQQIHALEHHTDTAAPANLPDLMQDYLDVLNSNQNPGRAADPDLPRVAKILAWQCMREDFRPWYVNRRQAEEVLVEANESIEWLTLLEKRLRVLVSRAPAYDQLRFNLDPLAEYLAALMVSEECGRSEERWDEFLRAAEQTVAAADDNPPFFRALWDCYEAKQRELRIPASIEPRLLRLAGFDSEDRRRRQQAKVLEHHMNALRLEDRDARLHAVNALGELDATFWNAAGSSSDIPENVRPLLCEVLCNSDVNVRLRLNAASVLVRSGDLDRTWPLFAGGPDPTAGTALLLRYAPSGGNLDALVTRLVCESDDRIRRGLILSLGEFDAKELAGTDVASTLVTLFRDDPDPGIHSATLWLLGQLQQNQMLGGKHRQQWHQIEADHASGAAEGGRRWYVTKTGAHPMAVLPGGQYWYGDSPSKRVLDHRFAISTTQLTVEQFLAFSEQHNYDRDKSPEATCPVNQVQWYDAAAYCNWLSQQEGIPNDQWCYDPNAEQEFAEGMRIRENYLHLTGYRLPTEEEWEYACRAGSRTAFTFGDANELLDHHGWYSGNSSGQTHPVAMLRPNDFGLFDSHGNVWEWCQNRFERGEVANSSESERVSTSDGRVLRGGSFTYEAVICRSAFRYYWPPGYRFQGIGFRVSRTYN